MQTDTDMTGETSINMTGRGKRMKHEGSETQELATKINTDTQRAKTQEGL